MSLRPPPYVKGFEVWKDGIYRIDYKSLKGVQFNVTTGNLTSDCPQERLPHLIRVAPLPILINSTAVDLSTNDMYLELATVTRKGSTVREWVRRDVIADTKTITGLAARGFPITSENAKGIVGYLSMVEASPDFILSPEHLASRCGFIDLPPPEEASDDDLDLDLGELQEELPSAKPVLHGWLIGQDWIGSEGSSVRLAPGLTFGLIGGLAQSGEWHRWQAKFSEVCRSGPVSRFLLFSQFAAPLLRHLPARSFVIHHWGKSSGGKTALALFGASVWGRPKGLGGKPAFSGTLNATRLSVPAQFQYIDDLPIIMDELQASDFKNKRTELLNLIYAIVLGQPRLRLNPDGSIQAQANSSWRTVVRFTGEQPLISDDDGGDLGGARNRLIQIEGDTGLTSRSARDLHNYMETEESFGLAGRKFLESLLETLTDPPALQAIRDTYTTIRTAIEEVSLDPRATHIAVVAAAQVYASHWLFNADIDMATEGATNDAKTITKIVVGQKADTYVDKVYAFLEQHMLANPRRWLDLSSTEGKQRLRDGEFDRIIGYIPRTYAKNAGEWLWLIPGAYRELLRSKGYQPSRFEADAAQAGLLMRDNERLARKRKLLENGESVRVIVLSSKVSD